MRGGGGGGAGGQGCVAAAGLISRKRKARRKREEEARRCEEKLLPLPCCPFTPQAVRKRSAKVCKDAGPSAQPWHALHSVRVKGDELQRHQRILPVRTPACSRWWGGGGWWVVG